MELEYRGIVSGTNEWVYGLPYSVYSENNVDSIRTKEGNIEYIKTDTLGRLARIIDGKKYYHGDMVKIENDDNEFAEFCLYPHGDTTCLNCGSFLGFDGDIVPFDFVDDIESIELIGNIYQNE